MAIINLPGDDNPLALNARSSGPIQITIHGDANSTPTNIGAGGDSRLPSGIAGLPSNYGGFTQSQVDAMGTDLAGNLPTFAQLAAGGGVSDVATQTGSTAATGSGAGNLIGPGTGSADVPWWQDLLTRGALIILGFIFVGVGLNMFGRVGQTIAVINDGPAKAAKKAGKAVTEAA